MPTFCADTYLGRCLWLLPSLYTYFDDFKGLVPFLPHHPHQRQQHPLSRSPALNLSLGAVALPLRWDMSMVEPPGAQGLAPVSITVLGQGALPHGG